MSIEGKTVSESKVEVVQQMTQPDANFAGYVHGGVILKLIDNTAWIVATRHARTRIVTASIDRVNFHDPVSIGDLLKVKSSINLVNRTSMELGVRIEAENYITGELRHTASAYLSLVSLDEEGKPRQIAPLILETEEDERRNAEALNRRKMRLQGVC
ncbi:MAG: acyl-CoA thioesterase [bacterium]|nr:acyl-CoA thioesterase [bacterium]